MKLLGNVFVPGLAVLIGCSSPRVTIALVGPNPSAQATMSHTGQLDVFSAVQECRDGNDYDPDPAWYQHTDYSIYTLKGKHLKHVFNSVGHYAEAPRLVSLPAGRYLVRAQANGYLLVEVPVLIEPGRTTRVHLDATWKPFVQNPVAELVCAPSGYPVGWRAQVETE